MVGVELWRHLKLSTGLLLRYAPVEGSSVPDVVPESCNRSPTYELYSHGGGVKLSALRTPLLRSPGQPWPRAHIRGPEAERKGHPATRPPRNPDYCITCPKSRKHSTRYLHSLPTPPSYSPRSTLSPPELAPWAGPPPPPGRSLPPKRTGAALIEIPRRAARSLVRVWALLRNPVVWLRGDPMG